MPLTLRSQAVMMPFVVAAGEQQKPGYDKSVTAACCERKRTYRNKTVASKPSDLRRRIPSAKERGAVAARITIPQQQSPRDEGVADSPDALHTYGKDEKLTSPPQERVYTRTG